jgi:hypothetical protein
LVVHKEKHSSQWMLVDLCHDRHYNVHIIDQ